MADEQTPTTVGPAKVPSLVTKIEQARPEDHPIFGPVLKALQGAAEWYQKQPGEHGMETGATPAQMQTAQEAEAAKPTTVTNPEHPFNKPFARVRENLNRMSDDLDDWADRHDDQVLHPVAKTIVHGLATAMRMAPVGSSAAETAAAVIVPPELPGGARTGLGVNKPKSRFEAAGGKQIKSVAPRIAYDIAGQTGPSVPESVKGKIGVVRLMAGDKEIGRVHHTIPQPGEPKTSAITAATLDPSSRGQGYGQQMYLRAAEEARKQGAITLTSDLQGSTSMDAAQVWDKLAEKGHPIEKVQSKMGSPGYKMDLTKPQVVSKPIDLSPAYGATGKQVSPARGGTVKPSPSSGELENLLTKALKIDGMQVKSKGSEIPQTADGKMILSDGHWIMSDGSLNQVDKDGEQLVGHPAVAFAVGGEKNLFKTGSVVRVVSPQEYDFIGNPSRDQIQEVARFARGQINLIWDIRNIDGKQISLGNGSLGDLQRALDVSQTNQVLPVRGGSVKPRYGEKGQAAKGGGKNAPAGGPAETRSGQVSETTEPEEEQRVSTRVPTSPKATEDPMSHALTMDYKLMQQTPKVAQGIADKILAQNKSMVFTPEERANPQALFESFIRQAKDNIKFIYNRVSPENQIADRVWYDGAHQFTKKDAASNDLEHRQAAAAVATQSPQKDWDSNVSLYERILDVVKNKSDQQTTPEMLAKGQEFIRNIRAMNQKKIAAGKKPVEPWVAKKILNQLDGKTFAQLSEKPVLQAAWLRLYDEAHNSKNFYQLAPDGTKQGLRLRPSGEPEKVAWGALDSIAKGVSVLKDGSRENISQQLGNAHKVRSFYNNIIEPNSPAQDVTSDTHHVGLSLMQVVAGNDTPVKLNFGSSKSAVTGLMGTYPLYVEATRRAAKELGIEHPRQLQSVTWVEWRKMFPPESRTPETKAAVENIWKEHLDGKITADDARQQIADYSERFRNRVDEGKQNTPDQGKLSGNLVPGSGNPGGSRGESPTGGRIPTKLKQNLSVSENPKDPETRFTSARHEAGHAVLHELMNPGSVVDTGLTDTGGSTTLRPPAGKTNAVQLTREEAQNYLAGILAGGMMEPGGPTTKHVSGDTKAESNFIGARAQQGDDKAMAQAAPDLAAAHAKVVALLADPHTRSLIDQVAQQIGTKGKLTGDEVRATMKASKP